MIVSACAGLLHAQGIGAFGFTASVSERLVEFFSGKFGAPAGARLNQWKRFAADQKAKPDVRETDRLAPINLALNAIPFLDDDKHWGLPDYWATPAESVASHGADCEDFSIAKYFMLKELGLPVSRLRLVYVKSIKLNQAHMVLAYYPTPDADPLVLDNLENTVRPASLRTDLIPVYSFNDEEVWIESRGKVGSPSQIRNWKFLIERLAREART